MSASVTGP